MDTDPSPPRVDAIATEADLAEAHATTQAQDALQASVDKSDVEEAARIKRETIFKDLKLAVQGLNMAVSAAAMFGVIPAPFVPAVNAGAKLVTELLSEIEKAQKA